MKLFKKSKAYGMFEYTVVAAGVIVISLIIATSMKKEYEIGPKLIRNPVAQLEKIFIADMEGGGNGGGTGGSLSASLCDDYFVYSEEGILFEEFKTFLETCLILRDSNGNKINDYEIENVSVAGGFAQGTVSANGYEETFQIKAREFNEVDVVFNELSPLGISNETPRVATSIGSVFYLLDDGRVMTIGDNYYGQLARGSTSAILSLGLVNLNSIGTGTRFKEILIDRYSVFFHSTDNKVFGVGMNQAGQLGVNPSPTTRNSLTPPTNAQNLLDIKKVVQGMNVTFLILEDGRVFAAGGNGGSPLGIGKSDPFFYSLEFEEVQGLGEKTVKKIVTTGFSTYFLMEDKTVKSVGQNSKGELGLGDNSERTIPETISGLTNVKDVVAERNYALFLLENGEVKVVGERQEGSLCREGTFYSPIALSDLSGVEKIVSKTNSTFLIMKDKTVKACGLNDQGQLGLGHFNNVSVPSKINGFHDVKNVFTDAKGTFFLMENGDLYATGNNANGRLGLGDSINKLSLHKVPLSEKVRDVAISSISSFLVMENGTVRSAGSNSVGQLGIGGTSPINTFTQVPGIQFNFSSTLKSITLSGDIEKTEGIFSRSSNHSGITETNWTNLGSAEGQAIINEPSEGGDWYYHIKITDKLGNTKWFSSKKLTY